MDGPPETPQGPAPWWLRVLEREGLATVFAGILLWFVLTYVAGSLSTIQAASKESEKATATIVGNQTRILEVLATQGASAELNQRFQGALLEALCYELAKTADDRGRCGDASRPGVR